MKLNLDGQSIELPCPHCGRKSLETIRKLNINPTLTCRHCRGTFAVDAAQFKADIAKVEKTLADLSRSLGRIGK